MYHSSMGKQQMLPALYAATDKHDKKKRQGVFLTLSPAYYGTHLNLIVACYERLGFYPTHLYLHPDRYRSCPQRLFYVPFPQDLVPDLLAGRATPGLTLLTVQVCADTTGMLTLYQVQVVAYPAW